MKKLIWAVDAFQENPGLNRESYEVLRALTPEGKTKAQVEPVYVLSPDQLNLSFDFTRPGVAAYAPAAEKALIACVRPYAKWSALRRPKVLLENRSSRSHAAATLSDYAKEEKADAIVIATHARKGISRMVMGSFAETLILKSKVPVVVVNPHAHIPARVKQVLFPTDLSSGSLRVLNELLDTLEPGAQVTLLNVVPSPVEPVIQSGVFLLGGGWVPLKNFLKDEKTRQLLALEKFRAKIGKRSGDLALEVITGADSVSYAITSYAKKHEFDLIAMAAESGAVSAGLMGSITRQVIRSAFGPVWVKKTAK